MGIKDLHAAFLSKMAEDEWLEWEEEDMNADIEQIMHAGIAYFKFPRCSLEIEDGVFVDSRISDSEIQVIATFMKVEWLERSILTWSNIGAIYHERDFSPGNLIDKLNTLKESTFRKAQVLESIYYRSVNGQPYDYSKLSGG